MTIRKYIPDFITSMNLMCGLIGVVLAFGARLDLAFYLMLAAAVCDFLDGFAARALKAYSDFGKELDSLADVVSFGVLPSVMLRSLMQLCTVDAGWLCWIPLLIAVFSALRLAGFNTDDRQKDSFIGLPTPAAAMLCASLCCFVGHHPASLLAIWVSGPAFIPVLSVCVCALLVCGVPMFSMKFHRGDPADLRIKRISLAVIAVLTGIACAVLSLNWSLVVLLTVLWYILKNLIYAIVRI